MQSCCFVNIWAIGPLSNPNEFGYFFLKLASENKYILSMFLFGFYLDRRSIVVSLRLPFHLIIYIILCDPPLFKKKTPLRPAVKPTPHGPWCGLCRVSVQVPGGSVPFQRQRVRFESYFGGNLAPTEPALGHGLSTVSGTWRTFCSSLC